MQSYLKLGLCTDENLVIYTSRYGSQYDNMIYITIRSQYDDMIYIRIRVTI